MGEVVLQPSRVFVTHSYATPQVATSDALIEPVGTAPQIVNETEPREHASFLPQTKERTVSPPLNFLSAFPASYVSAGRSSPPVLYKTVKKAFLLLSTVSVAVY